MSFRVVKQVPKKRIVNEKSFILEFGHQSSKPYRNLSEAQEQAKRWCREIRDEQYETIYIFDENKCLSIEMWTWSSKLKAPQSQKINV